MAHAREYQGTRMEAWKTYTPDGRMLEVEYADGKWLASCAGTRGSGSSARDAITTALASGGATIGEGPGVIAAWVAEHAARLEEEAGCSA